MITTVSSAAKAQLAAAAGADHVINYHQEDVVAEVRKIAPHGVNTIVEVSPSMNAAIDAAVVARHGSVAVYADDGGVDVAARPAADGAQRPLAVRARLHRTAAGKGPCGRRRLRRGARWRGACRRRRRLAAAPLPLEETAQAHEAVEDAVVGKVLIDITH